MNEIKRIDLLTGIVSDQDMEKLEAAALLMRRHVSVVFKIKSVESDQKRLIIQVVQDRNAAKKYFTSGELIDKVKNVFGPILPDWKIISHPVPYLGSEVDVVTPEWIQSKMESLGIKQVDIVNATGVTKSNVAAWVGGLRPMSQPVKAMFYYFIMSYKVPVLEINGMIENTIHSRSILGIKLNISYKDIISHYPKGGSVLLWMLDESKNPQLYKVLTVTESGNEFSVLAIEDRPIDPDNILGDFKLNQKLKISELYSRDLEDLLRS